MAKLPGSFNSEEYGDMGFELIPKGRYQLKIIDSEYKPTKKEDGHYLQIEFKIMSGPKEGSKLWTRLNLDNKSAAAVELANKELATICRAIGKVRIEDSEELHGCELTGEVDIVKGKDDNPDQNSIKNYLPLEGAAKPAISETGESKPANAGGPKRRPVFEED